MEVFIKECLYVLDYKDRILECIFNSDKHDVAGFAYEINVKDANTGYSDLTFKMPREIIDANGKKILNPRLAFLKPLTKLRYTRQVRYIGEEDLRVVNPDGSVITYHHNDYLIDFITGKTKYVMDYIVQPLDKNRSSIKIDLNYTAIDFPRYNLSKKKVGLTFDDTTITTNELSLYKNEPLSSPGSIQYLPWTLTESTAFQLSNSVSYVSQLGENIKPSKGDIWQVSLDTASNNGFYQYDGNQWIKLSGQEALLSWSPNAQSGSYPLTEAAIKKLINQTVFSYGILATTYYWPVTESGRFQGVMYEKGDYITLSLYNQYEDSEYEGSEYLNSITWDWGHLDKIQPYLSPNTASHYLRYILQNTNWKVKGDKENFRANTEAQPYYTEGNTPINPNEGEYYIKGVSTGTTIENKEFHMEIYRYENNTWVNKDNDTFAQIVNTGHTYTIEESSGAILVIVKVDKDFGTLYDIDIEQVEVSRSAQASVGTKILTDARYSLSVNNSNCYNAITEEAKLFDLYPIFDCENKTVSLKLNAGAQYGLKYRYGYNLKSSSIKEDGEKVITKLYATGGTDAQGSTNINIGDATRSISGVAPDLSSSSAQSYDTSGLIASMTALQESSYKNMVGESLVIGLDMKNKNFILSFPDNLYEKVYSSNQLEGNSAIGPVDLITLGSTRTIKMIYNPTGTDHCMYIYDSVSGSSYSNESKQLYKYDYANRTLRRNKTEYKMEEAVLSSINISAISSQSTIESTPRQIVASFMKCATPLNSNITLENKTYKSSVVDFISGYNYDINGSFINNFVLIGPNRVYTIKNGEEVSTAYTVGNYYYFENVDKYRYCFKKLTETETSYDKINRIAIAGYAFITLGSPEDDLTIRVNNVSAHVVLQDGSNLSLEDWLSNNYALRVEYDGTNLIEYIREDFNPNADEYLIGRSPYGTNYVYNFKYLYDNGWMDKEDILDIYRVNKIINNVNLEFYDRYTKALINLRAQYNDAVNNEEIYSSKADAQLEALMSDYWINPNAASKGEFSAFPGIPKFSDNRSASDHLNPTNHMYWEDITYEGEANPVKRVYFNIFGQPGTNYLYPNSKDNNILADNPHNEGQYHTTAKSLGWDSNVSGVLTIDKEIGNYTQSQDPSNQAKNYNEFIKKMKEYYYKAKQALEDIEEASAALEDLNNDTKEWQDIIDGYERYIQENYGQYIIEGSYSNTEQPYSNLLFDEVVRKSSSISDISVSEKFATPNITYSVNVVDSSGLFEYRNPGQEQCNDLVKKLHSLGQVVPRAGDYVSIYDTPMGMYGVPGLITAITRRLDSPIQNSITIDTSYSDADELVGNIITATNTVLNNKDVYGRAAIINNKGELSATTVSNALSSGTDNINIVSNNGKIKVDDNGLTCVNPGDTASVVRYNGAGILASNNGGITWRELMTPNGINANYINAGSINAGRVSITDGQYDITCLTSDGLAIKTNGGSPYTIGTFNTSTGAANNDWTNLTVFVGKDKNNNGVGYFNGYINASKGGNIGGWSIMPGGLAYGGTLPNSPNFYLGTTGITATIAGSSRNNLIFKAGSNFGVSSDGSLYGSNAYINGIIESISGHIAGWTLNEKKLSATGTDGKVVAVQAPTDSNNWVFAAGGTNHDNYGDCPFRVSKAGALYATNATISGSITATSGKIGGWTINRTTLTGGNTTLDSDGTIETKNLKCTGGSLKITKTGYLSIGEVSDHPIVSGLNVSVNGGIAFRNKASTTSAGTWVASINSSSSGGIEYGSGEGDHDFVGGNVKMKGLTCSDLITGRNGLNITGDCIVTGKYYAGSSQGVNSPVQSGQKVSGSITVDGDNGYEGGRWVIKFVNGICVNCTWYS